MTLDRYRQLLRDKMDGKGPVRVRVHWDKHEWTGTLEDFSSLDGYTMPDGTWRDTDFTEFHLSRNFSNFLVFVRPDTEHYGTLWPHYENVEVL